MVRESPGGPLPDIRCRFDLMVIYRVKRWLLEPGRSNCGVPGETRVAGTSPHLGRAPVAATCDSHTVLCYNGRMRSGHVALDHLVLATPDLSATAEWVSNGTGIIPSEGGQHVGGGTRNMLCSFGPTSYLEIIGPDPDQSDPIDARPFGIDDLGEAGMVAWAIAVSDMGAARHAAVDAGFDPGPAVAMQRRRPDGVLLSWRLTMPHSTTIPFLIEWARSPHPAGDAAPGLELVEIRARHPSPGELARTLAAVGVELGVEYGTEALLVEIHGPLGTLRFG